MRIRWFLITTVLALVLAGCGASQLNGQDEDLSPSIPLAPPSQESSQTENPIQMADTPNPQDIPSNPPPVEKFVALAKKDLSGRVKVAEEQMTFTKSEEVTWPDAALGCPAPGKVYAQGLVPGYRIWLNVDGVEYTYHTDWSGEVIFCPAILDPEDITSTAESGGPTPQIGVPIK